MYVVYHTPPIGRHSAFVAVRRLKTTAAKPNTTDCVWLVPGTARADD